MDASRDVCSCTTHPQLAVVLDRLLVILLDVIGEVVDRDVIVFDIFHDLTGFRRKREMARLELHTLFLKPLSSLGVRLSALPMTGMTLTRGERRRMSSMSISRRLESNCSAN